MASSPLPTEFAPAERASPRELSSVAQALLDTPFLQTLYDAVAVTVVLLNRQRQIVFANRAFLKACGKSELRAVVGLRQGEALDCVHAYETPGGCGTTRFCRHCGSVRAILTAQGGVADAQECRTITRSGHGSLDLLVHASPLALGACACTAVSVFDIADAKRREVLEQMFFHDLMNTAYAVKGLAETLHLADPAQQGRFREMLVSSASRLVDQITSQQLLTEAERGGLSCMFAPVSSLELVQDLALVFANHPIATGRVVRVDEASIDVELLTDGGLLSRVLGNMLKNALEAAADGEVATIGCDALPAGVRFRVHNPGHMSEAIQLQMFQRSFSTKGKGRGLGTYSMKLLTERYLQGELRFASAAGVGTTFLVTCPRGRVPQ